MGRKIKKCFFDDLNYDKMYEAYMSAKRGKTHRRDVILFSLKVESNLKAIVNDIENNKYKFGKYKEFYVYEPKKRKVLALSFRDRVTQTWYVKSFLEKYFVPMFINTSYACIKGRGMHKSAFDVRSAITKCSDDKEYENGYILKMDILKFFNNINRDILYEIISRKVYDKDFLNFTKLILDSSQEYDDIDNVSIPIGNYSSQMFANLYMHQVDVYIKEELGCMFYFRYMDDNICIFKSKKDAILALEKITNFLKEKLNLKLNDKTQVFKISQGVNFCGYKIGKNSLKLRNKGKKNLIKKLRYITHEVECNHIDVIKARNSLVGNIGYAKHANIGGILKRYFYLDMLKNKL